VKVNPATANKSICAVVKLHYTWCQKFSFALYLVLSGGAPLPEHGAASIPGGEKNIPAARPVEGNRQHPEAFRKGAWQVIATHTMKTINDSNLASLLSHPATRLSRPVSCTLSLALAAAQRSY
jgi:hypothetical protein